MKKNLTNVTLGLTPTHPIVTKNTMYFLSKARPLMGHFLKKVFFCPYEMSNTCKNFWNPFFKNIFYNNQRALSLSLFKNESKSLVYKFFPINILHFSLYMYALLTYLCLIFLFEQNLLRSDWNRYETLMSRQYLWIMIWIKDPLSDLE